MRTLHRVSLAALIALAGLAASACDEGRPERPPDPGVPIDDVPVVIQPDAKRDPGVPADPGLPDDPGAQDAPLADAPPTDGPLPDDPGGKDPGTIDPGPFDPGCVRKCEGKECGPDGCGGYCGQCVSPKVCSFTEGLCYCIPDCVEKNKQCGDDGCGGSCGECPNGLPCDAASFKCGTTGPCPKVSSPDPALSCADNVVSSRIGQEPSDNEVVSYTGDCNHVAVGTEKAYRFTPDQSGTITLTLTGSGGSAPDAALDVHVIEGTTCDGVNCIAWGHESVQFEAVAGTTYWFLIDTTTVSSPLFTMTMDCSWYVPPAT